ncbi:putative late blight resistance protein homolog R1A-3 [Salvia miltiorrhiza]|uniref:putative late blight resistance protein homolog R1A-3 n=1 Tax=Salvia miltiorrhiza TaxID=226208 RepID=UPI0025AC9CDA|nr:putative late blight resistance protein homolog R1A-3 [Salvia miltiorrhiza]XP_057801557.1 putative late blight resistance protein homolog R1A-3 [Salvia miltiorrhiza]XP_057801558.1 putative late blight resistance protein homolog R1A-3 [Salvia miltiorrhiza]XP_057801559.1 putative late blight resistance protein homolog R1A-3 [Salvia miltiorrhiza]
MSQIEDAMKSVPEFKAFLKDSDYTKARDVVIHHQSTRDVVYEVEDVVDLVNKAKEKKGSSTNPLPATTTSLLVNQEFMRSLAHQVVHVKSLLESFPYTHNGLKRQIYTSEDVIECILSLKNPLGVSSFKWEHQLKIAEKLKLTAGAVDCIKSNHPVNCVHQLSDSSTTVGSSSRRELTSKYDVVGIQQDLSKIKRLLTRPPYNLQVLPIVGMGGIGKTTLVKLVYSDKLIMEHFEIRGWLTISQDYSVTNIVSNLLASMKGIQAGRGVQSKISGEEEIHSCLRYRRYLIVVDDVWSKKAWDDMKELFPDDYNGSKIILTTRLQDVAAYADHSNSFHMMRPLSPKASWELLKKRVFGGSCPHILKSVGREIAAQCRGLPLYVVVVAGLLSKVDQTVDAWRQIAEGNDGQLDTKISLSYIHLPHHVKSCFLYMGGFPEDHQIRVSELIKLWAAEGFLHPNGSKCLEDEAEDCLEDLVDRGLVLVTSIKPDCKTRSCSLHDIMRDFCIRQSRRENLLLPVLDYLPSPILRRHFLPLVMTNYKRISVSWYDLDLKDSMHTSCTHSIICIPCKGYRPKGSLENFSLLKVLHVLRRNDYWDWEPSQVFDLIHLTYLAVNIPSSIVPPTISQLHNLQTLIIYRSEVRLPVEIWRLSQLRHLIAFSFHPLPHPEVEAIPLANLQTFSLAMNFVCVEMIPNIRKLGICYSEEKFGEGYHLRLLSNLFSNLFRLEKLKLERHSSFCGSLNLAFQFPLSLKKLTLSGWKFPWSHMKIVGSLPNLQELKLRKYACNGKWWETSKRDFVNLRLLLIDESNLQHWIAKSRHFPQLKCLMLLRCPDLPEIPIALGHIPTLELIEVDDCNKSLFKSARKIRRIHRLNFGDGLHVRTMRS